MMRIGFIEAGSGRGGSTYSLRRVIQTLQRDHAGTVEVFIFTLYEAAAQVFAALDVPTVHLQSTSFCGRIREMRRQIQTRSLDVLHCNNPPYDHRPFILAAKWCGVGVTVHYRCSRTLTRSERWLLPFIAHIFYNSQAGGDVLAREKRYSPETLSFVPNGVDLGEFAEDQTAARAALQMAEDEFVICLPATLQPGKGQLDAVDALSILRDEGMRATLLLAGGEHFQFAGFAEELREKIAAAELSESVQLLGHRSDMPILLAASDLVIQPSRLTEAWTNSLIEAMAAGRPVIGTASGGIAEVVDEQVGALIPPGDPTALAAAIRMMVKDRDRAAQMGRAAAARAAERFDIRVTTARMLKVFQSIAKP